MNTSLKRFTAVVAAAGAALAGGAGSVAAHGDEAATAGLTVHQRGVVRDAILKFRNVDRAVAAGYVPTDVCVQLPGVGGMGYHYVNPTLAGDTRIDPTQPEILLYYRDRAGTLRLAGAEYFAADADQDLATDADRPTLMGHPFEGPMAGHEPGMPIHYDLHVWVNKRNPNGELAAWNPTVTCPA